MPEGQLEVAFDSSEADAQSRGNFVGCLSFDCNTMQHFTGSGRQFGQGPLESIDFRTRLDDPGGIWPIVGKIQNSIDLGRADPVVPGLLAVLRDIDGGTKDIVGRTAYGFGIRYPLQAQEGFMQSFVRKIGRSQTTRELPDQAIIVLDQLPPQPHSIDISHVVRPPNTLPSLLSVEIKRS
jgi:hypothetical protein